ncbi:unnamed protein product [Polarella glacialis]|uniref:non-specific serine/threonine protein kinase n=1 Tax=Polarella glacialis TaxID=89957 RepID=A0A813D674_POLGL|nr:unnamed protein product [Polarella glacialis]
MEFADAGDLSGAISRLRTSGRKYHEREAMAVFAQLALALEFVHSKRILHRDLKSQNVFLTSAGVVKLGDFGIARVLQDCERCVETRIGTPHNMPPEMIEGRPYDFKADIWGLGVLLYEVLALTVPFSAASVAGLAVRICTTEPKPIPAMYSSELRALVSRMLSKQAADRPSASEIASLAHVRRGLAAMRPCTPAVASAGAPAPPPPPPATSFHEVVVAKQKQQLQQAQQQQQKQQQQLVRIPTPMGSPGGLPKDPSSSPGLRMPHQFASQSMLEGLDLGCSAASPKKVRHGLPIRQPPAPSFHLPGVPSYNDNNKDKDQDQEEFRASFPRSGLEGIGPGLCLNNGNTQQQQQQEQQEPPPPPPPLWLPGLDFEACSPASQEWWNQDTPSTARPYTADALRILRSALGECSPMSALLSELEQGWQPTPKGELSGVQMMTSRPSFGQ